MAKRKKSPRTDKDWVDPQDTPLNNPFASLKKAEATSPPPTVETPQEAPAPRTVARAVVRVQRKGRGGKTATLVSHLALAEAELEAWCKALRKQMGCGGQVEGDLLVFGGDQRDRVGALLQARGVRKVTLS